MTLFSKTHSEQSTSTNENNIQTLSMNQLRQIIGGGEDNGGLVIKK